LANLIIIFILIVIIGLLVTFSKGKIAQFLSKPATIYTALILWTLFGFVFVLDNSTASGCVIRAEETLSFENIAYSAVSVLLLTIGFFCSARNGLIVLIGELIYWTFKLVAIKGGYAIGLGRTPDELVVLFDAVALTLRLLLIHSRIDFVLAYKAYLLLPVAFFIMTLKILFLR
jgi:hypothetical protein